MTNLKAVLRRTGVTIVCVMLTGTALGDNLVGEDELLCAAARVTICFDDGTCVAASPWELNVPQFINVDLKKKRLSTTEASNDYRVTTVDNLRRADGRIYMQGIDRGRAYTFVIDEETGFLTVVVARDDLTVSVFGACTPTP